MIFSFRSLKKEANLNDYEKVESNVISCIVNKQWNCNMNRSDDLVIKTFQDTLHKTATGKLTTQFHRLLTLILPTFQNYEIYGGDGGKFCPPPYYFKK